MSAASLRLPAADQPSMVLEEAFAAAVGAARAVVLPGRAAALKQVLRGLAALPHSEVICSALSSPPLAAAIIAAGLQLRFVDCDPDGGTIDVGQAAAAIGPRTCALLVEHRAGLPADLSRLAESAAAHRLPLIADGGEAFGARCAGRPAAAAADATVFGAPLFIDGALLALNAGGAAERLLPAAVASGSRRLSAARLARLHDAFRAAAAAAHRRQMIAAEYRAAVAGLPAMALLEAPDDSTSAATMLSLRCSDAAARDRLTAVLQREAVAFHLPLTPLPQQPYYRRRSAAPQQFPVAEQLSRCVVDLPIAADPTAAEIVRTRMVLHAAARAAAGIRSVR